MKPIKTLITLLVLATFISLQSCAFVSGLTGSSAADLQLTAGAETATIVALNASGKASTLAPQVYAISTAIYSLSGGNTVPTVKQLQDRISQYTHGTDMVAILAPIVDGLSALYSAQYKSLSGNPKLATQALNDIALGVQNGCALYMPATASIWKQNQAKIQLALTRRISIPVPLHNGR